MFQTPKRPTLPPTPAHTRPCLPPLSSLLNSSFKLPSISDHYYPTPPPKTEKRKRKPEDKAYAFISHSPATFPSQEPSIDNAPLARRKRRRTSPNELSILNSEFEIGSTPNKMRRLEIAQKVNMTEKAIQIWFQNKRQSLRKQSSQEKEVTELMPIPQPPIISPTIELAPAASTPVKPFVKAHSHEPTESPNTSMDPDSSVDDSILVLNETRKKQPTFLNSQTTSTMTFKLMPNTSTKVKERLAAVNDKENGSLKQDSERVPLGEISVNKPREAVENLLSLRTGSWS